MPRLLKMGLEEQYDTSCSPSSVVGGSQCLSPFPAMSSKALFFRLVKTQDFVVKG